MLESELPAVLYQFGNTSRTLFVIPETIKIRCDEQFLKLNFVWSQNNIYNDQNFDASSFPEKSSKVTDILFTIQ